MPVSLQENCAILKELVSLRAQKSNLLGFRTHADYVLEMNMAKTSQTVATFLGSRSPLPWAPTLPGRPCPATRTHLPWLWQLGVYPDSLGFPMMTHMDLVLHVGGCCLFPGQQG